MELHPEHHEQIFDVALKAYGEEAVEKDVHYSYTAVPYEGKLE